MFLFEWKLGCCLSGSAQATFAVDAHTRRIRRKRYFIRRPKFSATFASRTREMYVFRPVWLETLHYNHFLGKFFVDFNRTTFISSCFRGGMKRANTVGYALALTGSGPSFMFPHRNIVVSFSVSRQSNVFTFQPSSTKAKVEGKYPPYGKLKDLRFWGAINNSLQAKRLSFSAFVNSRAVVVILFLGRRLAQVIFAWHLKPLLKSWKYLLQWTSFVQGALNALLEGL